MSALHALFWVYFCPPLLVSGLLCFICFRRKRTKLFHDGRIIIRLRGKAVLVLSLNPFHLLPPTLHTVALQKDVESPMLPLACCVPSPAPHSFHPYHETATFLRINSFKDKGIKIYIFWPVPKFSNDEWYLVPSIHQTSALSASHCL